MTAAEYLLIKYFHYFFLNNTAVHLEKLFRILRNYLSAFIQILILM